MKKSLLKLLLILVPLVLAFYLFLYPKLEIVSGYNAKMLCSCMFVSGIEQSVAEDVDLGYTLLWLASNTVDATNKSVHSNVWGMHPKVAVYRDGLGCTLVNGTTKEEVKMQSNPLDDIEYGEEIWRPEIIRGSDKMQAALQKAFDAEGENKVKTRAILAIKNGEIIGEAYAKGVDQNTPLLGWSMTKSITSTLAGILVGKGFWKLEEAMPITDWKSDERKGITLKNMLQMSSGLTWQEDYGKDSKITTMLYTIGDMGRFAADVPLEKAPDEEWKYSSGTTNIISRTMSDAFATREEYWQFPYRSLFAPLGMRSFTIETDASGHFVGSSYSYGTARDWAKLGLLYLNEGNWFGTQIIDSSWVAFSHTPAPASQGEYGGHFWLNRSEVFQSYSPEAYWMAGYHSQQVSIHPEERMVIVRLGVTYERGDFDFSEVVGGILAAAKD